MIDKNMSGFNQPVAQQSGGITPDELDDEERENLRSLAHTIRSKASRYLPEDYDVATTYHTPSNELLMRIEVACPTGQVSALDIKPTESDRQSDRESEGESPPDNVSKQFVAQTVFSVMQHEAQTPENPSTPAS